MAATVENIAQLLAQLNPNGGQTRINPAQGAIDMANLVVRAQKEQRSAPFEARLQELGDAWGKATDPKQKAHLQNVANTVRADYLNSGGSPIDMDRKYWGSDQYQGFQTGAGTFAKSYAGDNLTNGQKRVLAAITGDYEGRPTFAKQQAEADMTGYYNGQKTWPRQYQEGQLANSANNSSSGSDMSEWLFKQEYANNQDVVKAQQNALQEAYKYIDGRDTKYETKYDADGMAAGRSVSVSGWSPETKTYLKGLTKKYFDDMVSSGASVDEMAAIISKDYPNSKAVSDIIAALQAADSQMYGMGK